MQSATDWARALNFANVANWTLFECLWCIQLGDPTIAFLQNTDTAGIVREAAVRRIFVILFGVALPDPYAPRLLGARGPYQVLDKAATADLINRLQQLIHDTSAPLLGPPPAPPIAVKAGSGALINADVQSVSAQANVDPSPVKAVVTRGFADVGVNHAAALLLGPVPVGPVPVAAVPVGLVGLLGPAAAPIPVAVAVPAAAAGPAAAGPPAAAVPVPVPAGAAAAPRPVPVPATAVAPVPDGPVAVAASEGQNVVVDDESNDE